MRVTEREDGSSVGIVVFRQFDRSAYQAVPEDLVAGWVEGGDESSARRWVDEMNAEIRRVRDLVSFEVRTVFAGTATELAARLDQALCAKLAPSESSPYLGFPTQGATDVHWIEDRKAGVRYLVVQGPETKQIVELLEDQLDYLSSETIMEEARDTTAATDRRGVALYNLALDKMDRGFDMATFEIYAAAMRDASAVVRGAAVIGSAYLGWKRLAEPLRPLTTDSEPDKAIREDAKLLLARLEKPT